MAGQVAPFTIRFPPSHASDQAGNRPQAPVLIANPVSQQPGNNDNLQDQHFLSMIPASYRTKDDNLVPPRLDDVSWIESELDLERLYRIKPWFWMVGRPTPPRPLHHQKLLGREIFITEQMDMHLVWTAGYMYLKPLPRFLLEPQFWTGFLSCARNCACVGRKGTVQISPVPETKELGEPEDCEQRKLRRVALGFLFSYVALIRHESDLSIAKGNMLLPTEVNWAYWTTLVKELDPENIYPDIDERFVYGELRLSRLNKIFQLTQRPILRGYAYRWQQSSSFFQQYFGLLAAVTVYIAIILTAMQVGLATDKLQGSKVFMEASYGFTIFSILGPLILMALIFLFFLYLFGNNWYATVSFSRKRLGMIRAVQRDDENLLPAKLT